MIKYNPKQWIKFIFQLKHSDTLRTLAPAMMWLGIYTAIVCYLEVEYFELKYKSTTVVHSLVGFVISMLLVFRTNSAYERWWEGRKQWGALVNTSRTLASKVSVYLSEKHPKECGMLIELISDYPYILKEHLRDKTSVDKRVLLEVSSELRNNENFSVAKHLPNLVANQILLSLNELYKKGILLPEQYASFRTDTNALFDICGACERIKNTPIPFSYSNFIKKFIFLYVMTMPFGFVTDFRYVTIPIVMFVLYALSSLELIAEEIEDPFGEDDNDLPTDELTDKIKNTVKEIHLINIFKNE